MGMRFMSSWVWATGAVIVTGGLLRGQQPQRPDEGPISRARLPVVARYIADHNGSRFTKPGKERIIHQGTITRSGGVALPFQVIRENPGKIRVAEGANAPLIVGNIGEAPRKGTSNLTEAEFDLVETLLSDSLDDLLRQQSNGGSVQVLGSRFRSDDGRSKTYTGPYSDVYEAYTRTSRSGGTAAQVKRYYIDSDKLLLQRVRYTLTRGIPVEIEIRFENYQKIDEEMVPTRIVRSEDRRDVLAISFTSTVFGQKAADGIFERP